MSRYDKTIFATVVALGLVIAALSVASARLGPTVDGLSTAQLLDGTLVNSQIALDFTQPMQIQTVERNFHIVPHVGGAFAWSGNQMRYIPNRNLAYATTYHVIIGADARDSSGNRLAHSYDASFTTEGEHVLYLGTSGNQQGRLVLASMSGRHEIVGPDDGSISEYSPSFDRSLVVFVRHGSNGERADEIWLLSVADGSSQRVFRRPDWDISQAHFSADGRSLVFLASNVMLCRKYYGCYRDTRPEVYLLDLQSRKAVPFHSETDVPITNFISYSPGGQLAYTDLGSALTLSNPNGTHVIHVPNSGNSLEFVGFAATGTQAVFVGQTASSTGGDVLVYDFNSGKYTDISRGVYDSSTPSFSQSGARLAYAAYRGEQGIEPVYGLNVYDVKSRRTFRLTADARASDWTPSWSPDDRFVAFVRSQPQEAMYMGSGEIWVVRNNGRDARPLGAIGRDPQWVM